MKRHIPTLVAVALAALALAFFAGRPGAENPKEAELAVSAGPIKMLTLPLEGPTAGKLYFEITPTEQGAPSAFKVDSSSQAAVSLLTAARAMRCKIRVTYKADFTVTELEML